MCLIPKCSEEHAIHFVAGKAEAQKSDLTRPRLHVVFVHKVAIGSLNGVSEFMVTSLVLLRAG